MPVAMQLDADAIRSWARLALERLIVHEAEINSLNLFPVADRDTGTNMLHTLRSAMAAAGETSSASSVLAAMAEGAAVGARGNSGLILSQMLLGTAAAASSADLRQLPPGTMLARCLRSAERAARAAVVTPVHGTMLSVMADAADAAESVSTAGSPTAADAVSAAVCAARQAVSDTPAQLAAAGHPRSEDAGATGLLLLLEALAEVLDPARSPGNRLTGTRVLSAELHSGAGTQILASQAHTHALAGVSEPCFELQFLIRCDPARAANLRISLARLAGSVVIGGPRSPQAGRSEDGRSDAEYAVHVHTVDVGGCLEAAIAAGQPRGIRITPVLTLSDVAAPAESGTRTALIAVAAAPGVAALFAAGGAKVLSPAGSEVTESELLQAITDVAARRVIVLPNSVSAGRVAEHAAAARGSMPGGAAVTALPTKSPMQGLAAVAVHNPDRGDSDDLVAMAEAAAGTRFAEVVLAHAEAVTYAGRCQRGDVLGLIDGEVVEIGSDYGRVAMALVRRLIAVGGELVTVLTGTHPESSNAARTVAAYIRARHPLVEVTVLFGGQTDAPLLIGVE